MRKPILFAFILVFNAIFLAGVSGAILSEGGTAFVSSIIVGLVGSCITALCVAIPSGNGEGIEPDASKEMVEPDRTLDNMLEEIKSSETIGR